MKTQRPISYHAMTLLAVMFGAISLALHLLHGMELVSFILSVASVGGLVGGRPGYSEAERQQLTRSFQTVFEAQLLMMMAAYAFILVAAGLPLLSTVVVFLNARWPSLVISLMCLLLGLAGLRPAPVENVGGLTP